MTTVALYQEGDFHCAQDVIKIFSTSAVAKANIPKGFVLKDTMSGIYAVKKVKGTYKLDRWLTIDEYQVID